MAVISGTIKYL